MNEAVVDYWLAHYADGLCTLCGNIGIIDTRERAISCADVHVGRLNFCICPNGQELREKDADIEKWFENANATREALRGQNML